MNQPNEDPAKNDIEMTEPGSYGYNAQQIPTHEGIEPEQAPPAYSAQFQMQQNENVPPLYAPPPINQSIPVDVQAAAPAQINTSPQQPRSAYVHPAQQPAMYQHAQPSEVSEQFRPVQQYGHGYPGQYVQPSHQVQVVVPPNANQPNYPQPINGIVMQDEEGFTCLYVVSILSCLACCPIGIGAIWCTSKANEQYHRGNRIASHRYRKKALMTAFLAFVCCVIWAIINQ